MTPPASAASLGGMQPITDVLSGLPWTLIAALSITGIGMVLLSSLVGMRQKVEIPLWWGLYAVWVAIVVVRGIDMPFLTILLSSILAGILHGTTQGLLLERYRKNNPWYEGQMEATRRQMAVKFVVMGVVVGTAFGAIVGGIAWGLHRW